MSLEIDSNKEDKRSGISNLNEIKKETIPKKDVEDNTIKGIEPLDETCRFLNLDIKEEIVIKEEVEVDSFNRDTDFIDKTWHCPAKEDNDPFLDEANDETVVKEEFNIFDEKEDKLFKFERFGENFVQKSDDCMQPEEELHECPVCLRKFSSKQNLERHARIHIHKGEMPYKCETCGRKFNYKSNKVPKTPAERVREFRARKALLKQQSKQQQEPDAIPAEIRTIEKREKSAEATRRYRERKKALMGHQKKQAKTAAQRMREYRMRKKLRALSLQINGDIVIEHDNNQMKVDDENPTVDHVQKPRQIIGVGLNKVPKTSAERAREFRARKALLKQQSKQQQEPDPITSEIRTIEKREKSAEATRRYRERKKALMGHQKKQAKTAAQRMREYRMRKKLRGSSLQINGDIVIEHDNNQMEVHDENPTVGIRSNKVPKTSAERAREFRERKALLKQPSKQQQEPDPITAEIRTIEKREKSAEKARRYRERKKALMGHQKKQAKTAAQRMREYRKRKKLAKKILLMLQSDQDLDAKVSTSSLQVNQRADPSAINSLSAELTRRENS